MIKIYKLFVNIMLTLLIVILGTYVILNITNKVKIYNVKTGSMEDNIHVGDYVLIYKEDAYNVGDVVTYQKDNYFITHRIIKKYDDKFITKGDANNTIDEEINSNDIIGKVIISGGLLNIIITNKLAIAVIFIAFYLISCYLGDGKKEKSDIDEEEVNLGDNEGTKIENQEEEKQEEIGNNDETKEDIKNTEENEEIDKDKEENENKDTDELKETEVSKKKEK